MKTKMPQWRNKNSLSQFKENKNQDLRPWCAGTYSKVLATKVLTSNLWESVTKSELQDVSSSLGFGKSSK